jgi:glycosyltransferase involved in cell wall biosynthesis
LYDSFFIKIMAASKQSKIKILFFIGSYVLGGKERQMTELIRYLPKDEFEVYLLVKSIKVYYFDHIKNLISGFYSLETERFSNPKALCQAIRYIRRTSPDIIHSWSNEASIISIAARLFTNGKFSLIDGSIRDSWFPFRFYHLQWWMRKFINHFSFLVISNSITGLKAYSVDDEKGICIFNGFNFDRVENLPGNGEIRERYGIKTDLVVGMVGRFNPQKDWERYFRAANIVCMQRDDVTFMAVGDGVLFENLRSRYAYNYKIVFTGRTSHVEQLVSILDIGILLTNNKKLSEGISNSIMEYMALGKPVIANRNGGNEELIIDNVTGYIVDSESEDELINKILLLLENANLRKQIGNNGRERLSAIFNMDGMIRRYIGVYTDTIGCKK